MNKHIIFLIIIIGVISAGIVGANVMNNDMSMKQEVFDGIKVSVPADSEFVMTGDGVYRDSNYGIIINTFKDNTSMVNYLKNFNSSKIIPLDDQPPQSVAFQNGKVVNILVTNGKEGISIGTKDGSLTAKIANSIVFSDNHKSQKPQGLPFVPPPSMSIDQDFNLILPIIIDVDSVVFNQANFLDVGDIVIDDYNTDIYLPDVDDSQGDLSGINDADDLNDVLTDSNDTPATTSSNDNNDVDQSTPADDLNDVPSSEPASSAVPSTSPSSEPASSAVPSTSPSSEPVSSSAPSSSPSGSSSSQQELSVSDCRELVEQSLISFPELSVDDDDDGYEEVANGYVFTIVDDTNTKVGEITVDAFTGQLTPDPELSKLLSI